MQEGHKTVALAVSSVIALLLQSSDVCVYAYDSLLGNALTNSMLPHAQNDGPVRVFRSMLATAADYAVEKKFDDAFEKWKSAFDYVQPLLVEDQKPYERRPRYGDPEASAALRTIQRSVAGLALSSLGPSFEDAGRLKDAEQMYLASYKLSLDSDRTAQVESVNIEYLAKNYRNSGDAAAGAALITKFLKLAEERKGVHSFQRRFWQLKLADYYATGGMETLAKSACADFIASVADPNIVDKQTKVSMGEHIKILKANGFTTEARQAEQRLAELDQYEHDLAVKTVLAIEQSHIDGNVPAIEDFHNFMIRDLQKYFGSMLKRKVRVNYELLRNGPSQTGIGYPKYYAWVKVFRSKGEEPIEQGAVRISAEEKTNFVVRDFWNINKIHADAKELDHTFPKNLCPLVLEKASANPTRQ